MQQHVSTVTRAERSEPWQIQFYEPAVRDIIERAKQFSHCNAASINAFPLRSHFNAKAPEYIEEAITERQSRGLLVLNGKMPQFFFHLANVAHPYRLVAPM